MSARYGWARSSNNDKWECDLLNGESNYQRGSVKLLVAAKLSSFSATLVIST